MISEPKSYMVRAHKLQLDHGQYCGSILGPWIKLHAAHHESIWILGGEAS